MSPQEVQERLKLSQLKDKIWYVVPSCATTGEGLFEGLVSHGSASVLMDIANSSLRAGSRTTSRHRLRNDRANRPNLLHDTTFSYLSTIPLYNRVSLPVGMIYTFLQLQLSIPKVFDQALGFTGIYILMLADTTSLCNGIISER